MEESTEVTVTQQKIKNPRFSSTRESRSSSLKKPIEEEVIPNGTENSTTENMPEGSAPKPKGKMIKITKVPKTPKTEPVKEESSKTPGTPSKIPSPSGSPSSLPDFYGFDELPESNKERGKKEAFNKIISQLEDPEEVGVKNEGVAEREAMTVDDADVPDTDSNQMEIDEGNSQADSVEFSDKTNKENSKDLDVEVMETDSEKSGNVSKVKESEEAKKTVSDTGIPESGNQQKVEYCGVCSKVVHDTEDGIFCDGKCERWFHLLCTGLSTAEYDELSLDENAKWACNTCLGKPPSEIKPGAKPLLTVRKDLTATETPTPKRKMPSKEEKRPRVDISNPIFLKPFDYGWKRELVFRSTTDSQNKKQGDVYYYTPKGKKLRSLREISEYIAGTDLTPDNFTFWKDAIGCDPDKEIIRDAKFKVSKDPNSSPQVAKKLTPKTPKTPKTTPKLTATVTPLDSTSGLPVTPKASASVTPRVVLKGKPNINSGPKFKVTPSKTTVPGQTQKITITKGPEMATITKELRSSNNVDEISEDNLNNCVDEVENEREDIEIVPKNKFKRYGLLANKSTRNITCKGRFKSSSSSSSNSSEELTIPERKIKSSIEYKRQITKATGFKLAGKDASQDKKKKPGNLVPPSLSKSVPNCTSKLPLTPDTIFFPKLHSQRPRSPEIQFRPSDPSSYGCQTSGVPSSRPVRPSVSGIPPPLYHTPFETVLIVDTSSTSESFVNPSRRKAAPYNPQIAPCNSPSPVQWTNDCSIKVFSVETLPSKDAFANDSYLLASPSRQTASLPAKQGTIVQANPNDRLNNLRKGKNITNFSSISVVNSSAEVIVIDEDTEDNSSPPFLMRNSPPLNLVRSVSSPNCSPPSLQPNLPLPHLLPCPSRTTPEVVSPNYHENSSVTSIDSSGKTISVASSEETDVSNLTGSKYEERRNFKRERFYKRQKAIHEAEKLKRSFKKDRKLFNKIKAEEKKLQIEYLQLKVKIKDLKLSNKLKKITQE